MEVSRMGSKSDQTVIKPNLINTVFAKLKWPVIPQVLKTHSLTCAEIKG